MGSSLNHASQAAQLGRDVNFLYLPAYGLLLYQN